jgi:putative transport protein
LTALPSGVQVTALRRASRNEPASAAFVLAQDDVMFVVGPDKAALGKAAKVIGEAAPGRFTKDRRDLDYLRVFASRPTVVGRALGDIELPGEKGVVILQYGAATPICCRVPILSLNSEIASA